MKVVFGCPACHKRAEWPKNAYGEHEKVFRCSICGTIGEVVAENEPSIVEKLINVIESDESSRQKAAEREIALEQLAEFGYSSPS